MTNKTKVALAVGVTSLALAGFTGVGVAKASQSTSGTTLAQKLATAFNLNADEVQKVIEQDHQDQQAQRETDYEAKLTQAVTDGKITSAQKDLILAKHEEMQKAMEAARTAGTKPNSSTMAQERTSLETWAKDNNIPTEYLTMMGGRGHGGPGGPNGNSNSSNTSTAN